MNVIDKYKIFQELKLNLQKFASSGSFTTTGYNGGGYPDRYIFSWSVQSQDITNNFTVITYSVVASGGSTSSRYTSVKEKFVTIDGATQSNATVQQTYNGTTPFSGTQVIYHNTDGSRNFSASCGGAFYNYGSYNSTGSGSWDLPTIPRASQPSMISSDFNIGNTTTIYTNRASASFTHTITITFGSFSRVFYSVGTSVDWNTLTDASSLFAQIPNANSGIGTITCDTYNGGTYIGTKTTSFALRVTNSEPTFTDFSYLDENATTVAITGNNQVLIKNYSDVKVTCVPATPKNSATIQSYKAQIGSKYVSGASNVLDFGEFSVIDKIYATATDSRNLSTVVNKQPIMIDYSIIKTNSISLKRQNGVDATVFLSLQGLISSILVSSVEKNSIQVAQYRYKKTTDANYGAWQNVLSQIAVSNGSYSITDLIIGTSFATDSTYNFQFYIKDKLSEETVSSQIVAGIPLNSYRTGRMGIMKVPTQGALDVGGDIYGQNNIASNYSISGIGKDISNTNLNDLVGTGFFKGHTLSNSPSDGSTNWWYIEQIVHSQGEWQTQTAYPLSGGRLIDTVWTRTRRSGTWGSWVSQRQNNKITLAMNEISKTIYTTAWTPVSLPFDITYGVTVGNRLTRLSNGVRIGAGINVVEIGCTLSWYSLGTVYDITINIYKNGVWQGAMSYDASNDTYCTTTGQPIRLYVVEGDTITAVLTRGQTGNIQLFGNLCRLNVEAIE